jgi:hypothetical protein
VNVEGGGGGGLAAPAQSSALGMTDSLIVLFPLLRLLRCLIMIDWSGRFNFRGSQKNPSFGNV